MNRLVFVLPLLFAGCQHIQVQKHSNQLSSAVPNLYYGQVMDNLAMASASPASLPYFSVPTQGSTANTRALSASYSPGWDFIASLGHYVFDKQSALFGASTQNQQTFQVAPLTNPDKLTLLNTSFRIAVGDPYVTYKDRHNLWRFFYDKHKTTAIQYRDYYKAITGYSVLCEPIPPQGYVKDKCDDEQSNVPAPKPPDGCFCEGTNPYGAHPAEWLIMSSCKKDVPKHACYVGHFCDRYVWVDEGQMQQFSDFVLAIVDIATVNGDQTISVKLDPKLEAAAESLEATAEEQKNALLEQLPDNERQQIERHFNAMSAAAPPGQNMIHPSMIVGQINDIRMAIAEVDKNEEAKKEAEKLQQTLDKLEAIRRLQATSAQPQFLLTPRTPIFPYPAPPNSPSIQ